MRKALIGTLVFACALFFTAGCETTGKTTKRDRPVNIGRPYIDGHNHLFGGREGGDYSAAAKSAVSTMDKLGITRMVIMPPPQVPEQHGSFDVYDLFPLVRKYPERLACLGGGGTLNVMIHEHKDQDVVSETVKKRFRKQAMDILSNGALGFGEFSVVHFSLNNGHPYESVAADHPLFLLLADIAGEHNVPVDIHMEAIPHDMPLPDRKVLKRSGRNPKMLKENINGFERLLAHNRKAKVIWSHVGWCNTGYRTHVLCRELLQRHSNLYMSFKLSPESVRKTRPIMDERTLRPEWISLIRASRMDLSYP
jgi:hypothetical protein